MMQYRIVEWDERYEVDDHNWPWRPGKPKREGPLLYVRLAVHGVDMGRGWRKLLKRAGPSKALMVFGLFVKLLEIAGKASRELRNVIPDGNDDDSLAYLLGVPPTHVSYALSVLCDIGWIGISESPSGKSRKSQEIPASPPSTEQNSTEQNSTDKSASALSSAIKILFGQFWSAYPKKMAKDAAYRAFAKRKPSEALLATMLTAIERQKHSQQWLEDHGRYIPHPATWLNQARWEDAEDAQPESPEESLERLKRKGML